MASTSKSRIYRLRDGARVPGVTTILGKFQDPGGLLWWANRAGLNGQSLDEARQPAMDAGTAVHDLIEAWARDPEAEVSPAAELPDDVRAAALRGFANFLSWIDASRLTIAFAEEAMVSEELRCGGRLDAVLREADGSLVIADWKTGGLFANHIIQVAAYQVLWAENGFPELADVAHIVRFKRETGDFHHTRLADLSRERDVFRTLAKLYPVMREVEKRAR